MAMGLLLGSSTLSLSLAQNGFFHFLLLLFFIVINVLKISDYGWLMFLLNLF
jgi:hypothetical protein